LCSIAPLCRGVEPTTRPAAAPATAPAPAQPAARVNVVINGGPGAANNFADMQRRMVEQQKTYIDSLRPSGTYKQEELIRLDLADGGLKVATSLDTTGRTQRRVNVSDAAGAWLVSIQDFRRTNASSVMLVVNRYDFEKVKPGEYWQTSLNVNDQYVMLQEQGVEGSAWFHQMAGMARLNVTSIQNGRGRAVLNFRASTLLQLYNEHPEEVRKYVIPMMLRIGGRNVLQPGAADVYAVFDEIPPDPATVRKLAALLPRLDAELFTDRDAASKDLAKLGPAGVLAAMRLDKSKLSREQKGRLDAFIATDRRRVVDDPLAMRKDTSFLLDALEDDDTAVRLAAKSCLEAAAGHPVTFDTSLAREPRTEAVEVVRKSLQTSAEK